MLAHKGIQTPKFSAAGGTITTYSEGGISYAVHTFLANGTFIVYNGKGSTEASTDSLTINYLVVAGGAGGGVPSVQHQLVARDDHGVGHPGGWAVTILSWR